MALPRAEQNLEEWQTAISFLRRRFDRKQQSPS
jgi:hypothetical protein